MVVKIGILASTVAAAGLYFGGAFERYPRTVDGSPEAVMDSLADLDIRELPGAPGSTAEATGGIKPRFEFSRRGNQLEWTVYSGAEVATRMIATFEPLDGGSKTRISSAVQRGDAPEGSISPAFRSTSMTLGLFNASLDTEIEEMVTPGWGPHCDALHEKLLPPNGAPVGNAFDAISKLHRAKAELAAAGCNIDKIPVSNQPFPEAKLTDHASSNDDPEYQDRNLDAETKDDSAELNEAEDFEAEQN